MFVEIMFVVTIFAIVLSYFTWMTIAKNEKIIKCIVYGYAGVKVVFLPTAIPLIEIIMLIVFWDNHGHCSDKYEWYILVKVVFMIATFIVTGGLVYYFRKNKEKISRKTINKVANFMIITVYLFLLIWGIMAAFMFFDENSYDHSLCNHESLHTAIYYDWMFMEIILNFALLYLAGNIILVLILTGVLCGSESLIPQKIEQNEDRADVIELQTR